MSIKIVMLLLCLFTTIGLVNGFENHRSMAKAKEFVQTEKEMLADYEFELALWNVTEGKTRESSDIFIKWWYSKEQDKYYFFIPERLIQKGMHWMYSPTARVWIDDVEIGNGSLCALNEGVYQVEVESKEGKKKCCMEICYSSNIASLFLETESGSLNYLHEAKENYEKGAYTLLAGVEPLYYAGGIEEIHCRGNASWDNTEKKSYQIKLAQKASLLGMGEDKQWILVANAFDNTLLRNTIAFNIAEALGLAFTPDAEYVDVYANGEYIGNYLLTEKIEIGQNRVNINDLEEQMELLNSDKSMAEAEFFMEQQGRLFSTKGYRIMEQPEDITGGYLLELEMSDRYGVEASGFITSRMQPVVFTSPKYASYEQVSYIANRYQDFEDAVFATDGYSPYTGAYYADYIDMGSFARKYLLEEVTKNLDAAFTSQFMYKPEDSISTKFFAGPIWDYDKAIAASGVTEQGIDLHDPNGLYAATQITDANIWYALNKHNDFQNLIIEIYQNEMKDVIVEIARNRIENYSEYILDSAMNNAIRWQVFPEQITREEKVVVYKQKVAELNDFLNCRLAFLEQEWSVQ